MVSKGNVTSKPTQLPRNSDTPHISGWVSLEIAVPPNERYDATNPGRTNGTRDRRVQSRSVGMRRCGCRYTPFSPPSFVRICWSASIGPEYVRCLGWDD